MDKPEAILQAIRDCEVGAEVIIHLRDHEARHFAKNKEVLVVRPVKENNNES